MLRPIHSLLVANRGEIACRIIRTCRRMGIRTVAVFSEADREALHVKLADSAVYIGAAEPSASYLDADKIVAAALRTGADAIHPGYGFLSENAGFARKVTEAGLVWVGPHADAIARMGSKSEAKAIAVSRQVPVIPGSHGSDGSEETLAAEAEKIGYPVLLKAVAGGGGKGMRVVREPETLVEHIRGAKREALNAFGSDELLIEKYFTSARHIELQIFGDRHGNLVHLGERECSLQRRHQKIFEESPSPVLSPELRAEMAAAALRLAEALGYDNAGTVEFIYQDDAFYFLEVNTRLQVEHPVTECVTGLDLVEWQIRTAEGHPLAKRQDEIRNEGYALECRLYAEDPARDFLPGSGELKTWFPLDGEGIRFDSGVESGTSVSIHYDPLLSKIIAYGPDRESTLRRMEYALRQTVCLGLPTNQAFLIDVLNDERFRRGEYDTRFVETHFSPERSARIDEKALHLAILAAATAKCRHDDAARKQLVSLPSGWRNNFFQKQTLTFRYRDRTFTLRYRFAGNVYEMELDDTAYRVRSVFPENAALHLEIDGVLEKFRMASVANGYAVHHAGHPQLLLEIGERFPETRREAEKNGYISPMPAAVVKIWVRPGDTVKNGQSLLVLSSMKMENTISATEDGTVEEIFVTEGENITAGRPLLKLKEDKSHTIR